LKIGVQWGNPETTPGGNGPKFASSIRLDMRKKEMMKDKNEEVYGQTTGCTFIKNKTAPPLKKCDIVYHVDGPYKGQMDNYIVLASIGLEMDTIKKSGSWFEGKWLTARCQGLKKVSENLRAQDKKLLNSYIPAIQERYLDSAPLMFRF
jgi:recombination protein RecA